MSALSRTKEPPRAQLGTFGGVFTPSVLTILGIILFLRLGYVVGVGGLAGALLIIALANTISILTSISLSAIATNLKVKSGGDYYLISRTLGLEFGGAIGTVLFLAQSVSIAFYCIGLGEGVAGILGGAVAFSPRIIAVFAVVFLFIFAWLGADWATRLQYVVMAFVAAALLSFYVGGLDGWDKALLTRNWGRRPGGAPDFWIVFAIFFPAVTGFTQGVSMSGDLKDPGKSIPLGTLLSVGVSLIVYCSVAVVFAGAVPGDILAGDYLAMKRVASLNYLIDAGVIAATLSSAMASFLGAPRILQSLAADRIFPFLVPFAKLSGASGNPRRGVLLSAGIAFATIGIGNLNVIAPIVSMFFLISYGLLNYATFYEAKLSSPSFRPRFKWFDYRLSLLGGLTCLGVMLAINLPAGLVAMSILFAIYQYLKRTAGPARWADSRRSYHIQQVQEHLLAAAGEPEHSIGWRPQVLAFSDDPERRKKLLTFSYWVQGGSGLTTAVRILEGEGLEMVKRREEAEEGLRADISQQGLPVFPLVLTAPSIEVGINAVVQAFGVGPFKVNTIVLNWLEKGTKGVPGVKESIYGRNLRIAFRSGCNIIILAGEEEKWAESESRPGDEQRIDVWWRGDATSNLMLLFAYLMTRTDEWEDARIRVVAPASVNKINREQLRQALVDARIEAEPLVVRDAEVDTISSHSEDAAMVFLPFRLLGNEIEGPFEVKVDDLVSSLPMVAMVLAADDFVLDAEPEEGKFGEIAAAMDAFEDAKRRAKEARKEAERAGEEARTAQREVSKLIGETGPGADREKMEEIEEAIRAAEQAEEKAELAMRRAAKEEAKVEYAEQEAESAGAKFPGEKDKDKDKQEQPKGD